MAVISPVPKLQFFDTNGDPLAAGLLYTYEPGTTTNKATYLDSAMASSNANPIVLDARGECVCYLNGSTKMVLKTAAGATIWTRDAVDSGIDRYVASVAALKALAVPEDNARAITAGYYAAGDGGAGVYYWNAASTATDNGGTVIQRTAGGTGRWLYAIPGVNVRTFGAKGDGATDDTAKIQAAIDWAAGLGGAAVVFPTGNYVITGELTITASGTHLVGEGIEATVLTFNNTTNDCIDAHGTNTGAGQLNGFGVRDMSIKCGTKTAGRVFVISFAYFVVLQNLYIENAWSGIELYVTNNAKLKNVNLEGITGGGTAPAYLGPAAQAPDNCVGVFWHAPSDGTYRSDQLTMIDVNVNAKYSGADGFLWDGEAHTLNAYQVTALGCTYGLRIRNTGQSDTTRFPIYGEFNNFNVDGAMTNAVRIEAGSLMHFTACNITNASGATSQGSADTNAMIVLPDTSYSYTRSLEFANCNFADCRTDTVSCNARDVQFTGCAFYDGGKATTNTYAGLIIGANSQDTIVTGCRFSLYGANNDYKYGVQVLAGSVRTLIDGNYIYNAQTKPISWETTDSYSRCYNTGQTFALNGDFDTFINPQAVSLASGDVTLTAAQMLGGVVNFSSSAADRTATTATAAQIVAALQNPMLGLGIPLMVLNPNAHKLTLICGTGVTGTGNESAAEQFELLAATTRQFWIRITNLGAGTEAVVIYG